MGHTPCKPRMSLSLASESLLDRDVDADCIMVDQVKTALRYRKNVQT